MTVAATRTGRTGISRQDRRSLPIPLPESPLADPLPPSPIMVDERPRCVDCNKELAIYLTRPWRIDCPRCKVRNVREPGLSQ